MKYYVNKVDIILFIKSAIVISDITNDNEYCVYSNSVTLLITIDIVSIQTL